MSTEKILEIFKTRPEGYVSGEELSTFLQVSRAAIWKHIEKLRKEGYRIDAVPHLGYKLVSMPDKLLQEELQWNLSTQIVGKKILSYSSVDSTNTIAYKLGEEGLEEGSVIVAEEQKKGKGRLGREWISPKGVGIYLSCILRPHILPVEVPKITLLAAVAVTKAIREVSGLNVVIKWPNDILLGRKKICGILTELRAEQDTVNFVVIGIGINVNTEKNDLPKEATSLKEEADKQIPRVELAKAVMQQLESHYLKFKKQGFEPIIDEWRDFSGILGARVKVISQNKGIEGQAQDIDNTGALIIRLDNGMLERVLAGDVRLVR